MVGISDAQLAVMRRQVNQLLPDSCVISRESGTVNAMGEFINAGTTVGTVSCRVDPFNRQDSKLMVAMQEKGRQYRQLTVSYDADLADGDTITFDGSDYEVLQIDDDHSWNVSRRAVIARLG